RAARCALALQATLPGAPIALVTGRSEVGERWKLDPLIAGLQTAIAHGDPSRVVVDEVTAGLLGAGFEIAAGPTGLLLGAERGRGGGRGAPPPLGGPAPWVGGGREGALLRGLFDGWGGEPRARAVLVTAAPGMGKSRLREEVVRAGEARRPDLEVWLGRGDPM